MTGSSSTTRWIDTDAELAQVVSEVADQPRYGLDTEFVAERTYWPRLCLVQLAWPGHIALIDPLACDVRALTRLLESPATMITHAGSADLPIIERACGARPQHLFDTQLAAGFIGIGQPSLVSLIQAILGASIDKGDQLTDWARRPLPDSAQRYAASDVVHLLDLADAISERLQALGREVWATAECEVLLASASRDPDPDVAWWRVKGARSLRGDRAGVAQAVAGWRERRAQEQDLPPRFVLSDLTLAALVQRPPKSAEDLSRLRGVGNLNKQVVRSILDAVEAGRALSRDQIRFPPKHSDTSALDAAVGLLTGWAAQVASGEQIDPRLLATREDVRALVNGRDGRLDDGWRAEMLGRDLHALVEGQAVLRLVDGGKRLRFERSPDLGAPDQGVQG
ncbi:MAG: HRDC domain-containing protein [Acidimicrobiia bacterium]